MIELILLGILGFTLGIIISNDDKFKKNNIEYYQMEWKSCLNDNRELTEKILRLEDDLQEQTNLNKSLQKQLDKFKRGY